VPEGEPNTDGAGTGGESGQAHSGMSKADYDKWYAAGQDLERAKNEQAGR